MKRQPDPYDGPATFGIDVSHWQGDIDWLKVPDTVKFAIIRTGDGKDLDTNFEYNWARSGTFSDGSPRTRGSYHYFRADRDGKFQADLVLRAMDGLRDTDLPPAIDIEGGARKNLPQGVVAGTKDLPLGLVAEECLEFLRLVEAALGRRPLVYTGQAFHWWFSQANPQLAADFSKYPLWTPYYAPTPHVPVNTAGDFFPWSEGWTIWQFTADESVPGIHGPVDGNYFRGSYSDFQLFVQSLHHVKPAPPVHPPSLPVSDIWQLQDQQAEHIRAAHELQCRIDELRRHG